MSKTLETIDVKDKPAINKSCSLKNKHNSVLKSRENIFKPKCDRELKKKLKKYKLRRDGIEDPDILDVSKILVTSLRIKSPNSKINCNNNIVEQEEINQGNYLIKMVRKKKICAKADPFGSCHDNDKCEKEESVISSLVDEVADKKHTDAFKLMMDSRNKSIGSNSPGKERIEDQESKEIIEKREIKAKRILSLQKMAISKGSLKNKETEEFREKCIEKKMVKRAERFKKLITKTDSKYEQKPMNLPEKQSQPSNQENETNQVNDNSDLKTKPSKNKIMLCDIFNETTEIIERSKQSKSIQTISKDDIEFFNKLSPSIKKKENMLSYFQKIPKDDSEQLENNCSVKNEDSVIKVKFNSKRKKKIKILKSSEDLPSNPETVESKVVMIDGSNEPQINNDTRIKRKRNLNVDEAKNDLNLSITEGRPKRNVNKPSKYTDDVQIFSSDEELHIFTPKKKKNNEKPLKSKFVDTTNVIENRKEKSIKLSKDTVKEISNKGESKIKLKKKTAVNDSKGAKNLISKSAKPSNDKIPVKLAPIFVAKMQLSPADIEAKQKFLKSGVPEKLKKKVQNHTNVITFDMFPSVVHIQQSKQKTNIPQEKDWFNDLIDIEEFTLFPNQHSFKNFIMLEEACSFNVPALSKLKPEKILKNIKCAYPKFPVYRTYHLLSGKSKGEFKDCNYPDFDNSIEIINGQCVDINNENPDQLNWCDKYKPTSSKQIIGNFECIKELKKWLETWTENLFKAKQVRSDSSDFSDFYHSDTDSRDANRNNVLILTGQTGSGKTRSVYAVASELSIKVIEVNASSKRTGKIMLQDLQEATQSHKVNRAKSGSDNSQKLQEEIKSINIKKCGRPKKAHNGKLTVESKSKKSSLKTCETGQMQILESQESVRTGMSLILIDDADIVFEQDDGFCSAIAQLIQSSKRPVILVTSSLTCPHLQRFVQYGKVLHMRPVLSRMLGTWLDVMCLVDVGKCCTGLGAKVLDFYKGDIRKTINCLQFYMNSNKYMNQGDDALSQLKHNFDDEDSSMSWVDSENLEAPISNDIEADHFIDKQLQLLHVGSPLNVYSVWWNFSAHYKDCNSTEKYDNKGNSTNIDHKKEQCSIDRLSRIAHVLDTISMVDYYDHTYSDMGTNFNTRPWYAPEAASLFENENFESYNKSSLITKDVSSELLNCTITAALKRNFKQEKSLNCLTSTISIQRNRDKIVSRHKKLSTYLHPAVVLDHRATALDYWPTCRTICRIEKNRTDSNVKRNNRFCHYLKSLNILGKNDFFDSLADSLT